MEHAEKKIRFTANELPTKQVGMKKNKQLNTFRSRTDVIGRLIPSTDQLSRNGMILPVDARPDGYHRYTGTNDVTGRTDTRTPQYDNDQSNYATLAAEEGQRPAGPGTKQLVKHVHLLSDYQ